MTSLFRGASGGGVDEDERAGQRLWSAFMLACSLPVMQSIMLGRPVMAQGLSPEPLRRALRGGQLPAPGEFVHVTGEMLDAVEEAGPLQLRVKRGARR
jgi:hypothetical protein